MEETAMMKWYWQLEYLLLKWQFGRLRKLILLTRINKKARQPQDAAVQPASCRE